jgi:phosphoribosylamine--glycine ligase
VEKKILERVVHPAIRGMAAEGHPYQGVLYVGLMIDERGDPQVIEFNVRFGDPETQPLMLQMEGDLLPLLDASARGGLDRATPPAAEGAAVCVVLASGGYPRSFEKGFPIQGLESAAADPDVVVFHAGTKRRGDAFVTHGGRVLGVTARGADVAEARRRAYAAADRIRFEHVHLRRDIASRALPGGAAS